MTRRKALGIALGLGMLAAGPALAQDAAKGESFFKRACAACHTVEAGKNKIGPSLHGVVGRKSGSVEGFAYSPAMKSADKTWDDASLSEYLKDPKGAIPGNKMAYAGVKNEADLKSVIAYLETAK
jgi:cytochrome c